MQGYSTFRMLHEPASQDDIEIEMEVVGEVIHAGITVIENQSGEIHKRHLKLENRTTTAQKLFQSRQPASSLYYRRLSEMSDSELQACNVTHCQTPKVLRQAVHEVARKERLSENLMVEVDIQKEAWRACMKGKHIMVMFRPLVWIRSMLFFIWNLRCSYACQPCGNAPVMNRLYYI